jgi:hypothetical protein
MQGYHEFVDFQPVVARALPAPYLCVLLVDGSVALSRPPFQFLHHLAHDVTD